MGLLRSKHFIGHLFLILYIILTHRILLEMLIGSVELTSHSSLFYKLLADIRTEVT